MRKTRNIFDILLFTEIFQGLLITIKHFFSKPVTQMYPFKPPVIYPRFRGVHYMKTNEKGEPNCVGCYLCSRVCPSECIDIDTDAGPQGKLLHKNHSKYIATGQLCIFSLGALHEDQHPYQYQYIQMDTPYYKDSNLHN